MMLIRMIRRGNCCQQETANQGHLLSFSRSWDLLSESIQGSLNFHLRPLGISGRGVYFSKAYFCNNQGWNPYLLTQGPAFKSGKAELQYSAQRFSMLLGVLKRHHFSTSAAGAGDEMNEKEKIVATFVEKEGEEKQMKGPIEISMLEAAHENDIELKGRSTQRSEDEDSHAPSATFAPMNSDCSVTDTIAIECKMVGVSSHGTRSALARVTLVNTWGNVIYDEFVRPVEPVVDFRSEMSGIRPHNLMEAQDFSTVQNHVSDLMKGRIIVGHSLWLDLKTLLLNHPRKDRRDTSEYMPFKRDGKPTALRNLAYLYLGVKIQEGTHCPVEDARAAMAIYQKHKKEWEISIKQQIGSTKKIKEKKQSKPADNKALKPDHAATLSELMRSKKKNKMKKKQQQTNGQQSLEA
ncbi:hypothetical protein AMTRI_Chr01g133370 [Amborella trichopoda]